MATFDAHGYQGYAIRRIVEDRAVGLLLGMGLGKTVIVLTALDEMMYDRLTVRRALVIAPKKVAEATWQAEAAKWDHLSRLRITTALGDAAARRAAVEAASDVTVINRENVVWLAETYAHDWPFDMVVVDESSSFKSPAAKRFKALRRMLPRIARMVILTGTPAPNGIEDLWAQIYLLDRGERLEANITRYRARYFDYNPWRHEYTPKSGAFEAVRGRIADICVSMRPEDYLELPEMVTHDIPVALEPAALKAYRTLEKEMLLTVDGEDVTAMSAAALTGKLLQLCGGAVYDGAGEAHAVHGAKIAALEELLEALGGEHCLLFYGFRHELPRLFSACAGRRARLLDGAADAEAWNRGEVDVLLAHPASCAYGLNLQDGGHHVVWYTLTWSLELYQQANARLHRQGQTEPVIVHRLLVQGGMDEDVAAALEGKRDTQDALLDALKARIGRAKA